jgi:hypothetical protein
MFLSKVHLPLRGQGQRQIDVDGGKARLRFLSL